MHPDLIATAARLHVAELANDAAEYRRRGRPRGRTRVQAPGDRAAVTIAR